MSKYRKSLIFCFLVECINKLYYLVSTKFKKTNYSHNLFLSFCFLVVFLLSCSKDIDVEKNNSNLSNFDGLRIKECVFSKDCPQPRCIGATSLCQNSSCVIVGDCISKSDISLSCNSDLDCYSTGCSKEFCVSKSNDEIITTCVFNPEFDCLKQTYCGCSSGECSWKETYKYRQCLQSINMS